MEYLAQKRHLVEYYYVDAVRYPIATAAIRSACNRIQLQIQFLEDIDKVCDDIQRILFDDVAKTKEYIAYTYERCRGMERMLKTMAAAQTAGDPVVFFETKWAMLNPHTQRTFASHARLRIEIQARALTSLVNHVIASTPWLNV